MPSNFKRIKDYVLGLKETGTDGQTIVTPQELRSRPEATDADWRFADDEMLTAVGHLENYGCVKRLRTSKGEQRVLLDRWHNPPASSVQRFVDRLEKVNRIVVVGTNRYRLKYDNLDPQTGTVVAAECRLISVRMRGPEPQKRTVVPVLLEGVAEESFPPCLREQVFCDFRDESAYFTSAFDLILSLYQLPPNHPAVADLRESLRGPDMR